MEEVDKIIVQSLKEIGCSLDDDIESLKQFTAEMVVDAAVRCLTAIRPNLGLSPTLPASMSARYKVGTAIAEACIDVGYTGEIGYQTFLYSSEVEVRRVFMFLVEKLPKESEKTLHTGDVGVRGLRAQLAEAVRRQLAVPWSPSAHHGSSPVSHSFVSVPLEMGVSLPSQKRDCTPQEWREFCVHRLPFLDQQVARPALLLPSIISHHARQCQGLETSSAVSGVTHVTQPSTPTHSVNSWMQVTSLLYAKEPTKKKVIKQVEEENKTESESQTQEKEEDELQVIERIRDHIEQLTVDVKNLTGKLSQVTEEKQRAASAHKERMSELDLRQRTLELLPDSAANMSKLQGLVDEQAASLVRLGAQWEKHRAPLVTRYRHARQALSNRATESNRQIETARGTRERLQELKEELSSKEALQARLTEECEKQAKTVSRTAYTRRILEIIGNIKKQKDDIDKVVEDTIKLQREINMVTERVARSFAHADETVFKDCKHDETARRVYKMLLHVHAGWEQIVNMTRETGEIEREIRDLEDQVEIETAKDTASKLERINADLGQMRQESASLRAQLQRLTPLAPS